MIYTYWDPARVRWYDQTVATIGSESTVYTAIAVDEADGVHLAYADDLGTGHLVYVDGTTWLTNTIETGGHPAHASIDIDSAGFPHIAYNRRRAAPRVDGRNPRPRGERRLARRR